MGGTYKATGINLKSVPLGESDRLLTILTSEFGLIRAVAPGARKYKSSLRGRSNLFVMNDLLLVSGRSLDKVIQAESVESFPSIGSDLGKLTAGQYLAELALCQALSDHPQPDLFALLREHLTRLDQRPPSMTLANLVQATYHLLAYGGVTPQVFHCCLTQQPITPDLANPDWSVQFDVVSGGLIALQPLMRQSAEQYTDRPKRNIQIQTTASEAHCRYAVEKRLVDNKTVNEKTANEKTAKNNTFSQDAVWEITDRVPEPPRQPHQKKANLYIRLNAQEVIALQRLAQPDILNNGVELCTWLSIERVLRHYAQYYFEQPIRSAALIETCFVLPDSPPDPIHPLINCPIKD